MPQQAIFKKVTQVGMVVRDCRATAQHYWDNLGIGPWRFYTLNPSNTFHMMLHGKPVSHSFRAALASVGDVTLELIEPLSGESLYAEFLNVHGEGLHHVAFAVQDFSKTTQLLRNKGYKELQSGRPFDVNDYTYFSLDDSLGFIAEFNSDECEEKPFPPPEFTIP